MDVDGTRLPTRPRGGADLCQVATTIRLSRQAMRIVRQNYAIAVGVNAGGLLVGAVGALNPWRPR